MSDQGSNQELLRVLLDRVKDDVNDLCRRVSALEMSHRSLCKSHEELEGSHNSLNRSFEVILCGVVNMFETYLQCVSSSESPRVLRFVVPNCDVKGDVEGAAA